LYNLIASTSLPHVVLVSVILIHVVLHHLRRSVGIKRNLHIVVELVIV
jgi:hypothetical protein